MLFLSTFISGLDAAVVEILRQSGGCGIRHVLDGAIVYESRAFAHYGCFNNTFEVICMEKSAGRAPIAGFLSSLVKKGERLPLYPLRSRRHASFRIVTSSENTLVAVNPRQRDELERVIAMKTGLTPNRAKPGMEFWLLTRSEGFCFFLRRITNARVGEKRLEKGELRPELTHIMNWLSEPDGKDVFADPFSGSGAILFSRVQMGKFQHLYATDIDAAKMDSLRREMASAYPALAGVTTIRNLDIRDLPSVIPEKTVDKVVTDPPWGFYESCDIPALYRIMLDTLLKVARKGAVIVLLTARKKEFCEALAAREANLAVVSAFDILVSGKKAAIYKMLVR